MRAHPVGGTDHDDTDHDDTDQTDEGRRRSTPVTLFRMAAGVIIVASFGVWAYAYSGLADRDAPDLLADRATVAEAEAVCAAAVADVDAMPGAREAVDGPDRAEQILAATDRFEQMVDDLDRLSFADGRDSAIIAGWLDDWRVLLQDRRNHAAAIAVDPQAQFLVSDVGVAERLDRRVSRLANTNAMGSCGAPTDV